MTSLDRMRRVLLVLASIGLSLLVAGILLEVGITAYYLLESGRFESVAEMLEREQNTFIQQVKISTNCSYLDTLFPHPYLGFVHHANEPCGPKNVNNVGLFGPDYPAEKSPTHFTILLTGGSVAAQLEGCCGGLGRLQAVLNARYESSNGRPFLVLNGGDGAWKQPQQTILFLLHANAIDAVVTLDGFNEHYAMRGTARLEIPANSFLAVNPAVESGERRLIATRLYSALYSYSRQNWLLSHSYAAYGVSKMIRESIRIYGEGVSTGPGQATLNSLFALPQTWDEGKRSAWNMEEYKKYIRVMDAAAHKLRVKTAYFIQPVPAIGKALTSQEVRVVGDLGYRDVYASMTSSLVSLREEGIPIFSLLEALADVKDSVYADPIHFHIDRATGESLGYNILANRMADRLEVVWGLRRKARTGG